jgi:predicted short-subunit dehydrogenase-like oxidoreductase (DUF2520 family)
VARGDVTVNAAPRIAIVGTGPVGRALACAYVAGGGEVCALVSRRQERADEIARRTGARLGSADLAVAMRADVVLFAVPDRALPEAASRLDVLGTRSTALFVHTSGALPGDVLAASGRRTGSLHPLQAFPDVADDAFLAARVAGAHWFHEGDGADVCAAMVGVWRGTLHRLAPGGKALYHAGAAMLSNHTVALFDAALAALETAGVARAEAQAPLAALLSGTAENLAAVGVPAALTGPIARGDVATIRRHLDALSAAAPQLVESYAAMARRTLVVARAKGSIDPAAAAEIERLLG